MIPDWLRREVINGLQKLFVLGLPATPSADAIASVGVVWLEAIALKRIEWDESLDLPRVHRAFGDLYAQCERWPPPKLFLDRLGNRDPPRALPPPPLSPAEIARNRERVRVLAQGLFNAHCIRDKGHSK